MLLHQHPLFPHLRKQENLQKMYSHFIIILHRSNPFHQELIALFWDLLALTNGLHIHISPIDELIVEKHHKLLVFVTYFFDHFWRGVFLLVIVQHSDGASCVIEIEFEVGWCLLEAG